MRMTIAALLLLASPVMAAEPTNMIMMDGSCEQLLVGEEDLSDLCQDGLLQMIYDTGRVGLYAFAEGRIVTFSGDRDEVIDGRIHHYIDKVLVSQGETDIATHEADGLCIYENPYAGPAHFTCSANDGDGVLFELAFTTDGNPPVDQLAAQ